MEHLLCAWPSDSCWAFRVLHWRQIVTTVSDQFARETGMATTTKAEFRVEAAAEANRLMKCWPSRSRLECPLHSDSERGRTSPDKRIHATHHASSRKWHVFQDPEHVSSGLAGEAGPSAALPILSPGDLGDNVGARVKNADQLAQCAAHSSSHSRK